MSDNNNSPAPTLGVGAIGVLLLIAVTEKGIPNRALTKSDDFFSLVGEILRFLFFAALITGAVCLVVWLIAEQVKRVREKRRREIKSREQVLDGLRQQICKLYDQLGEYHQRNWELEVNRDTCTIFTANGKTSFDQLAIKRAPLPQAPPTSVAHPDAHVVGDPTDPSHASRPAQSKVITD